MLANTSLERIGQKLESRKSKQYWKPHKSHGSEALPGLIGSSPA